MHFFSGTVLQWAPALNVIICQKAVSFASELAHGSIHHKAQDFTALTDKHAVVMRRKFPMFFGGEYVTASRVTDLEHLYLTRAVAARDPDWRAHPCFSFSIQYVKIKCSPFVTVTYVVS